MTELTPGTEAADFALPRDGGGTVRLSDLRGRPVVLFFYPKDDTAACTTESIAFTGLKPDFEAAGAVVLGISPDPVKKHDRFVKKYELGVPLLSDETHAVLEAYGLWKEKSMYGRTYMGVERTTLLLDRDGRIARVWPKVKVAGHADEVLEAVRAL